MNSYEKDLLHHISDKLRQQFADRIVSVHAFGSRVRGDHDTWSDFDVLVIVKNKDPQIESGIISVFVDEEIRAGASFTPVVKDIKAFLMEKQYHTPFYATIIAEGVLV